MTRGSKHYTGRTFDIIPFDQAAYTLYEGKIMDPDSKIRCVEARAAIAFVQLGWARLETVN